MTNEELADQLLRLAKRADTSFDERLLREASERITAMHKWHEGVVYGGLSPLPLWPKGNC